VFFDQAGVLGNARALVLCGVEAWVHRSESGDSGCSSILRRILPENCLGRTWSDQFRRIFGETNRLVVCLSDEHHQRNIWPTFERDCFLPRIAEGDLQAEFSLTRALDPPVTGRVIAKISTSAGAAAASRAASPMAPVNR
jgi:hypothetical protein